MPDEKEQAILSQSIGKLAASEPDKGKRQQLVTTQSRNPKLVDASANFTRYKNQRALQGYKKGGKVKKTGLALVHKGEKVLTKKQQKGMKSSGRMGK